MSAKVLVTVASGASGVVILACLVMVGVLFQDINNLYDEVMDEMVEFRVSLIFGSFKTNSLIQSNKHASWIFFNLHKRSILVDFHSILPTIFHLPYYC